MDLVPHLVRIDAEARMTGGPHLKGLCRHDEASVRCRRHWWQPVRVTAG